MHRTADLAGATTKDALFDATATALDFPAYFGRNWDALHDCLVDLEWLPPAAGYALTLTNTRPIWREAPEVTGTFVQVWLAAAGNWADGSKPWDPDVKAISPHLVALTLPRPELFSPRRSERGVAATPSSREIWLTDRSRRSRASP